MVPKVWSSRLVEILLMKCTIAFLRQLATRVLNVRFSIVVIREIYS